MYIQLMLIFSTTFTESTVIMAENQIESFYYSRAPDQVCSPTQHFSTGGQRSILGRLRNMSTF